MLVSAIGWSAANRLSPTPSHRGGTHTPRPFDLGNPGGNDTALLTTADRACLASSAKFPSVSLLALNSARHLEGLPPMVLPPGFWALPFDRQTLIVVDEERVRATSPR